MSGCELHLALDRPGQRYRVGERVRGAVSVRVGRPSRCRALTLTRRWRTHGRGNEARGPITTLELFAGEWQAGHLYTYPFSFEAPPGPLTYHGHDLNVDWYVAAHADLAGQFDARAETELLLVPGEPGTAIDHGPGWQPGPLPPRPPMGKIDLNQLGLLGTVGCVTSFLGLAGGGLILVVGLCNRHAETVAAAVAGMAGGAAALGGMYRQTRRLQRTWRTLEPVEVRVEPAIVAPGASLTCAVAFTPNEAVELGALTATLIGAEEVVSGSGTNETRHRHLLHEVEVALLPPRAVSAGEPVAGSATFRVPPDAPATFLADHNALRWLVRVRLPVRGWPDWIGDIGFTVRP